MINQQAQKAIESHRFNDVFLRPLYDTYCFSNIPGTIKRLLLGSSEEGLPSDTIGNAQETYDCVLVFLIDGFGWHLFQQSKDLHPFLSRFENSGIVNKLTSQFPSTTAPCATTIHTGLPVGESGIYEWFYYEPSVDAVIAPLLFSFAGDTKRNTLLEKGILPETLFPDHTIYEDLEKKGVSCFAFQPNDVALSPFSSVALRGAKLTGYENLSQGIDELNKCFQENEDKKSYYFFYYSGIDSAGHKYGPSSSEVKKEIEFCFNILEREMYEEILQKSKKKTACIVIADHGQTSIDPKTTIYLNKTLPECIQYIKKTKNGDLIVPCGSSRDFFMHIEDAHLETVQKMLQEHLKGKAEVVKTKELLEEGFFGRALSKKFLDRVGNLVVLPYKNNSIWWYEKGRFENPYYGNHGGLTPEELETIFLFLSLN